MLQRALIKNQTERFTTTRHDAVLAPHEKQTALKNISENIEVAYVYKMGHDENNKCRIMLGKYKGFHVPGAFGQLQCLCSPRNNEKLNYSRYCLKKRQEN